MTFRPLLGLALILAAQPAQAGDGFLDSLFGSGRSGATPPNPFASNYPSAPPSPADIRAERERRAVRRERGEGGPVPPARVPE